MANENKVHATSGDVDLIPGGLNTDILRIMRDNNHNVFRKGLVENSHSHFEDPTYLGFSIEIDPNSALFTQAGLFIDQMAEEGHADIVVRKQIYNNFVKYAKMIFNSQYSAGEPGEDQLYVKQHYINSITGLDSLTKKYVKFREDKLTFELYEDIALFSTYLATTYNNLIFSYETGRILIPENLMYFNLYIKISEIRNLTSTRAQYLSNKLSDDEIAAILNSNSTCMIYKLTDCLFDFFESKPFENTVTQSGIDQPPPKESVLNFDLYFKRVNLTMNAPLVDNALRFNNNDNILGLTKPQDIMGEKKRDAAENEDILKNDPKPAEDDTEALDEWNKRKNERERQQDNEQRRTRLEKFTKFDNFTNSHQTQDLTKYTEEYQKLFDYNTKVKKDEVVTFTSDSVEITDEDGNIRTMTPEQYLRTLDTNEGQTTFQREGMDSQKTRMMKIQGSWEEIRRGNNSIKNFYRDKLGAANKGIENVFGSQAGGIISGVVNTAAGGVMDTLKKYENMLLQKKNEILEQFLYELKKDTKVLLDYNVYEDDVDPMLKPLDDLKTNVGSNVADQLISNVKGLTDTNIFGR